MFDLFTPDEPAQPGVMFLIRTLKTSPVGIVMIFRNPVPAAVLTSSYLRGGGVYRAVIIRNHMAFQRLLRYGTRLLLRRKGVHQPLGNHPFP